MSTPMPNSQNTHELHAVQIHPNQWPRGGAGVQRGIEDVGIGQLDSLPELPPLAQTRFREWWVVAAGEMAIGAR
jgi:hypothetical protein